MRPDETEWKAKAKIIRRFGRAWSGSKGYAVRIEVHDARMRGVTYPEILERIKTLRGQPSRASVRAALAPAVPAEAAA